MSGPADYSVLLDEEVKAYIARCDALYPPDAIDLDIAGQRRVYDAMCADFDRGRPDGVSVSDRPFGTAECRVYDPSVPATATVLYCHGGGFVVGGLDSHDSICAEICDTTGLRVVAVDYPLAPEHTYPQDFEAAWDALQAVGATFEGPVVLCGDSAGGNLCAALAHKARTAGDVRPAGQVLIYPGLGGDMTTGSYVEHAHAPQLTTRDIEFYVTIRPGGTPPEGDPFYAPLSDIDFSGLPPTVAFAAECDPLASDCPAYVRKLEGAGGQALWVEEKGLVHGYLRARSMSSRAADSFGRICTALSGMAAGTWPVL